MNDAIYCAVFIDDAEELYRLFSPKLAKRIDLPHMTVRFVAREGKPVNPELYGKDAELIVKGYACDGKNEGLSVEVWADDPHLQRLCDGVAVPHITLSVSEDGKPVDTGKLKFEALEDGREIVLRGTYGAWTKRGLILKAE